MKRSVLCLILIVIAASIYAGPVWQNKVNLRESMNVDYQGASALSVNGSVVYTWTDLRSGSRDIYAQRYGSAFAAPWESPLALTQAPGTQDFPVITSFGTGMYLVAYTDYHTNLYGDIRAQIFSDTGEIFLGSNGVLIASSSYSKQSLQATLLTDNTVLISWIDTSFGNREILGVKINGSGNLIWLNPIRLTYSPNQEQDYRVATSANGGFILAYQVYYGSNSKTLVMPYNQNGTPSLVLPIDVNPAYGYHYLHDAVSIPNQSIAMLYSYELPNGISSLALAVVNHNGTITSHHVLATQHYGYERCQLIQGDFSTVFATWTPYSSDEVSIMAQKIDLANGPLWPEAGVIVTNTLIRSEKVLLAKDNSGGAYIAWDLPVWSTIPENIERIKIAKLSSSGTVTPLNTGLWSSERTQSLGSLHPKDDGVAIAWQGLVGDNFNLQNQIISPTGTALLEPSMQVISGGISGDIDFNTLAMEKTPNGVIAIWEDRRDYYNRGLFYQILDHNGNIQLEAGGRLLCRLNPDAFFSLSTVLDDQGRLGVIWLDSWDPQTTIGMQLIDSSGALVWGEDGIRFTVPLLTQNRILASFADGAFYLGWTRLMPGNLESVFAQKIVNGIPQWGENGILLAGSTQTQNYSLQGLSGRYYIMNQYDSAVGWDRLRFLAQLLNPDGSSAWDGDRIYISTYAEDPIIQTNLKTALEGDDLILSWIDLRQDYNYRIYSQKISSSGNYLWNPEGVHMGGNTWMGDYHMQTTASGILHFWFTYGYLNAGMLDTAGEALWLAEPLIPTGGQFTKSPSTAFDNGSVLFGYVDYSQPGLDTASYFYLNGADSEPSQPTQYILNAPEHFGRSVRLSGSADRAYISWDEVSWRKYYGDTGLADLIGIYVQAMSPAPVSAEDPLLPPTPMRLAQNFPNPFNPETTISFSLDQDSHVSLQIFNTRGQLVNRLIDSPKAAGNYSLVWDGRDDRGNPVSSGVYLYKLSSGSYSTTRKMILMK